MTDYQLHSWKLGDYSADAAKTQKNKTKLWSDLRRDSTSVIIINGKPLLDLIRQKIPSLPIDTEAAHKVLLTYQTEDMLDLVKKIIKEELLDSNDPKKEEKSKSLIEYLYQAGPGYIAANALTGQLMMAGYPNKPIEGPNKVDSHPFEEHKTYLSKSDANIEITSTCKVVNVTDLYNSGTPLPLVHPSNKETLIAGYTKTKVNFDNQGEVHCSKPTAVLVIGNETLKNVMQNNLEDYYSTSEAKLVKEMTIIGLPEKRATKFLNDITNILENYKAYLIEKYTISDSQQLSIRITDPLYINNDKLNSLPKQKLAIVMDLLDIAYDKTKSDQNILLKLYNHLESKQDVLKQHQKPKEFSFLNIIKEALYKFFGINSQGEKMVQNIENRLSKEAYKFFKETYNEARSHVTNAALQEPTSTDPGIGKP